MKDSQLLEAAGVGGDKYIKVNNERLSIRPRRPVIKIVNNY